MTKKVDKNRFDLRSLTAKCRTYTHTITKSHRSF